MLPTALEALGLPRFEAGGSLLNRVHPVTPLALVALGLRCLASRAPGRTAARLVFGDPGVVLLAATARAGLFAVLADKTPMTPLVDTFVLPVAMALLLRDLDAAIARRLAVAIALRLAAGLLCLALAAVAALSRTGFFEHALQRFTSVEGSASTRITMFRLLEPMSLSDLMLRPDKDLVATLLIAVLAFFRTIQRSSGAGASIVLAFCFILVSATASVPGNTTTIAMIVALVLLFLRCGTPVSTTRRARVV